MSHRDEKSSSVQVSTTLGLPRFQRTKTYPRILHNVKWTVQVDLCRVFDDLSDSVKLPKMPQPLFFETFDSYKRRKHAENSECEVPVNHAVGNTISLCFEGCVVVCDLFFQSKTTKFVPIVKFVWVTC